MIKYKLNCKNCNITFDSWFANSSEFEKLKKRRLLNCHNCNSIDINKSLMAPNFINNSKDQKTNNDLKNLNEIKKTIKEYQKFIKQNFEYVGENFTYEARSIHYNEKNKNKKGIFGTASKEDIKELKEEGIDAQVIPWIKNENN